MCYRAMSARVKQLAVIEFLTAENMITIEIRGCLKAVYGEKYR